MPSRSYQCAADALALNQHNIKTNVTVRFFCVRLHVMPKFPSVAVRAPRAPNGWVICWCNLPGWRWATIKQVALDRLSRSLHSDVCDSDGCNDVVVHSTISGRGGWRERAALNNSSSKQSRRSSRLRYLNSAFWRGSFILSSIGWRLLRLSPCYHSSPLSMKLIIPSRPFGYDQV